jgi:hypothetical protein
VSLRLGAVIRAGLCIGDATEPWLAEGVLNNACLDDNEAMALSAKLASPAQAITGNGQGCTLR